MSLESDVRRLSEARPLSELPREALQLLAFSCKKRSFAKGETLFRSSDESDGAFVVLEGEIRLRHGSAERWAKPGALIGFSALLTSTARGSDAEASQAGAVLVIPRETFRRVLTEFPEAANRIQASAATRARALVGRLELLRRRHFAPARSGSL